MSSTRLQAAPRAQRTQPWATSGTNRLRLPRCSGRLYVAFGVFRPSRLHLGEQNLWCSARATNSRQQWSHRRCPKVTPAIDRQDGWPCSSRRPTGSRGLHRTFSRSDYKSFSRIRRDFGWLGFTSHPKTGSTMRVCGAVVRARVHPGSPMGGIPEGRARYARIGHPHRPCQ